MLGKDYTIKLGYTPSEQFRNGRCIVYKVNPSTDLATDLIIKMSKDKWTHNHISREHEVLVQAKGLECLPELKQFYDDQEQRLQGLSVKKPIFAIKRNDHIYSLTALVKEFIPKIEHTSTYYDPYVKLDSYAAKVLEENVRELHKMGFTCLDLTEPNIIIDPKRMPHIIDTGYAETEKTLGKVAFAGHKKNDLSMLRGYLLRHS